MDQFKICLFTSRLVVFHETFAGLGVKKRKNYSVKGWQVECPEVTNSFWAFLLENRDAEEITLWLDNCTGQNKNWLLISMLLRAVNGKEIAAKRITLSFLEVGHTYNAADSIPGHVETAMKAKKKIYDINDFIACVARPNTTVKVMAKNDFLAWTPKITAYSLNKLGEHRPYLNKMAMLQVRRGSAMLFWKQRHSDNNFKSAHVLTKYDVKTAPLYPCVALKCVEFLIVRKQSLNASCCL